MRTDKAVRNGCDDAVGDFLGSCDRVKIDLGIHPRQLPISISLPGDSELFQWIKLDRMLARGAVAL
jgi:hypothetical protein